MKFEDFKIGIEFYTARAAWLCVDVGTRTVVAYQIKPKFVGWAWDEVQAEVFYPHDFEACFLKPKSEEA